MTGDVQVLTFVHLMSRYGFLNICASNLHIANTQNVGSHSPWAQIDNQIFK